MERYIHKPGCPSPWMCNCYPVNDAMAKKDGWVPPKSKAEKLTPEQMAALLKTHPVLGTAREVKLSDMKGHTYPVRNEAGVLTGFVTSVFIHFVGVCDNAYGSQDESVKALLEGTGAEKVHVNYGYVNYGEREIMVSYHDYLYLVDVL